MSGARVSRHTLGRAAVIALLLGGLTGALVACEPRPESPELEIRLPAEVPAGLSLRWHHVNGADRYRLVFMRMTGVPVCTVFVEQQPAPAFVVQRDSMPSGLAHGWQLIVEVRAMRHGEPMAAAGVRPLKTP